MVSDPVFERFPFPGGEIDMVGAPQMIVVRLFPIIVVPQNRSIRLVQLLHNGIEVRPVGCSVMVGFSPYDLCEGPVVIIMIIH